jgi:maleate cis-trans isomerase
MLIEKVDPDGLANMVTQVERAARELASTRPNVILMAGTAGAFNGGPGFDRVLTKRIAEVTGIPATTSMTSVLDALRALGLKRIAVATSYIAEVDALLAAALRADGVEVATIDGMGILKSIDMGDVTPEQTLAFARAAFRKAGEVDGYFISCGNLRTLEVIKPLEQEFGKPVISSNQCGIWRSLTMSGVDTRGIDGGLLFAATPDTAPQ